MDVLTARETYDPHPDDAWKRLKMRVRKPQELAIVQALAAWRDREARERDVPRQRVVKDDAIYEIAQQGPRDSHALGLHAKGLGALVDRSRSPRSRQPGA